MRRGPRGVRASPPESHLQTWRHRYGSLADALDQPAAPRGAWHTREAMTAALAAVVNLGESSEVWLALAVLTGRLPDDAVVVEAQRRAILDGPTALTEAVIEHTTELSLHDSVEIARNEVIVDVAHTVSTVLTTGIQRVARETVRRWFRDHTIRPVSWTLGFESFRDLTPAERERVTTATAPLRDDRSHRARHVVVPWRSTLVVPELAAEPNRSDRLRALAKFGTNRTAVIGFDCVPITSAETTQFGFGAVFSRNLSAVRYFDTVAAISGAAAAEYSGWRSALSAIGVAGPEVHVVPLPVEVPEPTAEGIAAARRRFTIGHVPLVLVVGSHEPRKNHVAVLHAAELLWREGLRFSLTFVGGNAWGSDAFIQRMDELQRAGRPVESVSRISDDELFAAYRVAAFTVFPSLNEGFGLPVAESLASGTPAITSTYGSMLEIATGGGALTVDPRDDHAIAGAMRTLLTDEIRLQSLHHAARQRAPRTWDDYAADLWKLVTG